MVGEGSRSKAGKLGTVEEAWVVILLNIAWRIRASGAQLSALAAQMEAAPPVTSVAKGIAGAAAATGNQVPSRASDRAPTSIFSQPA